MIVRCTQGTVPGWEAWALWYDRQIFGEHVLWSCTIHRERATVFATEADALAAAQWLERANRGIKMRCEVER